MPTPDSLPRQSGVVPDYVNLYIPKGQALLLRFLLLEASLGYAVSNPRVKLLDKVEKEIAKAWPDEAMR